MDLFTLVGRISVDTTDFHTKMSSAMDDVQKLIDLLNKLNGMPIGTGTGNTSSSGTNTSGLSTTGTTSNTSSTNGSTTAAQMAGSMAAGAAAGQSGWTVAKGAAANLLSQAASKAIGKAKELWNTGWERNINEEKVTAQMATFLGGDMEVTKGYMEKLSEFALDTPLNLPDTWGTALKMLNFGLKPERLMETMQMAGDLVMGDSSKMQAFAKAYSEILGNEMLKAQEANQLINTGVPVYQLLEAYYASEQYSGVNKGIGSAEIKAHLNDGSTMNVTVPAEDIEAAFMMATSPGGSFYNAMANMMNSSFGQEQRIGENIEATAANVTKPFMTIMNEYLYPFLSSFTESFAKGTGEHAKQMDLVMADNLLTQYMLRDDVEAKLASGYTYDDLTDAEKSHYDAVKMKQTLLALLPGGWDLKEPPSLTNEKYDELYMKMLEMNYGVHATPETLDKYRQFYYASYPNPWADLYTKEEEDHGGGRRYDDLGGSSAVEGLTPGNGSLQQTIFTLIQAMSTQKEELKAATQEGVAAGLSGVTITGHVTTGDVRLDTGVLAGSLAPQIDIQMGWLNRMNGRGDA